MARKLTTREYVMIGGLAAAVIVVYVLRGGGGFGFGGGSKSDRAEGPELGEAPVVLMANLEPDPAGYDPDARNLFDYYTPPPPKRPPPPPRPPRQQQERKPVQRPPAPVKQAPRAPAGPSPPPITFKYIGFLGPNHEQIAVFEGDEDEMTLARAGDIVEKQFRLVEFKYESVIMGYVDERFKDKTTELRQQHR